MRLQKARGLVMSCDECEKAVPMETVGEFDQITLVRGMGWYAISCREVLQFCDGFLVPVALVGFCCASTSATTAVIL